MDKLGVTPDVIDKKPASILEINYNSNKVQEGNELTPTLVKDPPTVKWETETGNFYSLVMTDPDAPSRANPKFREWHHWLVGNIPENDIGKGEVLSEYVGAGPPENSGLHRYVFLVFKQPGKVNFSDQKKLTKRSGEGRGQFSTRSFAKKYNLGDPIAGNLFQAKWDSYVPKLYKQLAGK